MIDWKGELEAVDIDGRVVPVKLASYNRVQQPNSLSGNYELAIGLEGDGKRALYFRADGTQTYALPDDTRPWTIRNRQQWGAEIPVNGVRPAWLRDDDVVQRRDRDNHENPWGWPKPFLIRADGLGWGAWLTHIRLPANHWVYRVLRWNAEHPDQVPFEPFGGADTAPSDWDEGEVLLRNGEIERVYPPMIASFRKNNGWQRGYRGDPDCFADLDIIGYRKRVAATTDDMKLTTPPIDADKVLAESIRTHVSDLNELLSEAAKRGIRAEVSTGQITSLAGPRWTRTRLTVDLSKVL